jgi:hypothetical protein
MMEERLSDQSATQPAQIVNVYPNHISNIPACLRPVTGSDKKLACLIEPVAVERLIDQIVSGLLDDVDPESSVRVHVHIHIDPIPGGSGEIITIL